MVSQQTIDIVKSTAPVLKKNGQQITTRMYEIMFQTIQRLENNLVCLLKQMVLSLRD